MASIMRPLTRSRLAIGKIVPLAYVNDVVFKLCEPSIPLKVEIVFIHGLQLYGYKEAYWKTWISGKKDVNGREFCWPIAWLSKEFPGARIWSISYDSSALRTSKTGNMDEYLLGESLVQSIVGLGANIGQENRPIVFVCHSLGGLVVKGIVINAHRRVGPNYATFLQNIRGFHFYATPHDGSKLADLAAHLPKMGEMVGLLRVINTKLERLNAEFQDIVSDKYVNKWKFAVVAQTHKTGIPSGFSVEVVPEASARHTYKCLAVDADYFGVCKPETQFSSSYLSLTEFIKDAMSEHRLTQSTVAERQLTYYCKIMHKELDGGNNGQHS